MHYRSFQGKEYTNLGATYSQHNEPITGIVVPHHLASDSNDNRAVYLATLGFFSEAVPLSTIGTPLEETLAKIHPPWTDEMERHRQQYDLQYELGGFSLVRAWGLATFDGWTALAFTMHPGDTLEYTTRAEESTVIIFSHPDPDTVFPKPADISDERVATRRAEILDYILSSATSLRWCDLRSARLVYAACICAIYDIHHAKQQQQQPKFDFLNLARQALTHLSSTFNLPITEELTYCDAEQQQQPQPSNPLTISPKPASLLEGAGGWIFEKCQTCFRRRNQNVGLSWRDENTAVCENGHTWSTSILPRQELKQNL